MEGVEVTPEFWRGRRVLITGVTGFKGSWLTLLLRRMGAKLSGFALPPPDGPSLFALASLGDDVDYISGDLRDLSQVMRAVRATRPEVIFHLGAQPLVRASYETPVETFATNVMGVVHVLEAARYAPEAKAVVVITSDKCYEDRPHAGAYREDDRLGGYDPYASSKACAELVASAFRSSFFQGKGPRIVTARAGNVIGGGDWARDRLVPDVVTALAAHREPVIRNPACVRPWQHVLDPLAGYLLLAQRSVEANDVVDPAWNFGPNPESMQPVSSVAGTICQRWGGGASWRHDPGAALHETHTLTIDSGKARAKLGWEPGLPYARAVEWTTDWYASVARGADPRRLTVHQIQEFMEVAA